MVAFLSPREMFEEQLIEWQSTISKRQDYTLDQMQIYAIEAEKKIAMELKNGVNAYDYIMSVSNAIIDGSIWACNIFKRLNLNEMHAYAVLEKKDWFDEELDKLLEENISSQYD